ncbi:MAG: glycosyltransferase family 4 protein, partial [bacterium]|nr:glycosyltransferase family 4 protein [bacterium]
EKNSGAKFFLNYTHSSEKNILIYSYGEGSILTDFILKLETKKILRYHGVTSPKFFMENSKSLLATIGGNIETRLLIPKVSLAFAMSGYTKMELKEFGFQNVEVLPIFIDFDKYDRAPVKHPNLKTSDKDINLLFVGRVVPNKKFEDIIKTFYYYKKINPRSNLFLVGETFSCPKYVSFLKDLIKKLKLNNVYLTGAISFDELVNFYRLANVFLCMSEHEGFCVPLLEGMYFNLPVVAYNSTAIPHTLGNAGVLINKKNYAEVAELINIIVTDKKLNSQIIAKQKERLQEFTIEKNQSKLAKYIETVK